MSHHFGWIPDSPDSRDHRYLPATETIQVLKGIVPPKVDLRTQVSDLPIYIQDSLGSCTANAGAYIYRHLESKQGNSTRLTPSRLFIYYNTRLLMGTVDRDSGATVRDTLKTMCNTGVCSEELWPYLIGQFKDQPPPNCYRQAAQFKVVEYVSLTSTLESLKTALYEGLPIMFGFNVYSSFETIDSSGQMPVPVPGETLLGGHAVCLVGYDDEWVNLDGSKGAFIVRNSWGVVWGKGGYFYMPYTVTTNPSMCNSFWVVRIVTNPNVVIDPTPEPNQCQCKCVIC